MLSPLDAADCIADCVRSIELDIALGRRTLDTGTRLDLAFVEGFSLGEASGVTQTARARLRELPDKSLSDYLESRRFENIESRREFLSRLGNEKINVDHGISLSDTTEIRSIGDRFATTFMSCLS